MMDLLDRLKHDVTTLRRDAAVAFRWTKGRGWRWRADVADDIEALISNFLVPPTHRHVKSGGEYIFLGYGKMQTSDWVEYISMESTVSVDMQEVAIYRAVSDGSLWARPKDEFEDGRFVKL